ncbi:MAG: YraN family protein [Burkholderiales bacterium]
MTGASRTQHSGDAAEALAAAFLKSKGLTLVERNYRCRLGEIDLILRDGATLVFAEVRLRSNLNFGGAAGSVTAHKQHTIMQAARHYLRNLSAAPRCRFDVVLLTELDAERIHWIKNAFEE